MPIADRMLRFVEQSATVKKMFEEGARLKAIHGDANVFDFSIGNPDLPPPPEFKQALRELVQTDTLGHGYMPTAGHQQPRAAIAAQLSRLQAIDVPADMLLMTVGACGALNNILKALVDPGGQILTPAPFFVGYRQYAFVADAELKTVPTDARFHLDLPGIEAALTPRTRVVLINSPNNPTGAVYAQAEDADLIIAAAAAANTMYVVNAPSLFQLAVAGTAEASVDVSIYRRRRDLLCDVLRKAGYAFNPPEGAFYLFPKSPLADDAAFCELLKQNLILATPGAAFGGPGYFRLSFAVPEDTAKSLKAATTALGSSHSKSLPNPPSVATMPRSPELPTMS